MKTLLSKEDLHDGVTRMADKIAACYEDRQLTIVGVLTGSVVLMADLIRVLDLPMRVGVVILPQFSWPEARARWKSLEDRGFAHGWTYDHLAWRDLAEQSWFGTIPTLTAAACGRSSFLCGHAFAVS